MSQSISYDQYFKQIELNTKAFKAGGDIDAGDEDKLTTFFSNSTRKNTLVIYSLGVKLIRDDKARRLIIKSEISNMTNHILYKDIFHFFDFSYNKLLSALRILI